MKELLLKAIELPVAERYRLAFLIAESMGYTLMSALDLEKPCACRTGDGLFSNSKSSKG